MDIGGKRMKVRSSIRSRIIINFGAIVIATVIVLEVFFVIFVQNYYFGGVEQILRDRVTMTSEFLNRYFNYSTAQEKSKFLFENSISSYDSKFLIQVLDSNGAVIMDSNGFSDPVPIESEDVRAAFENRLIIYEGKSEATGERIMSATRPLVRYNQIDGAIRYTVSLDSVYKEVRQYVLGGILLGFTVILFFMVMAIIISKSIVNPIKQLNTVAKHMALGDFEKKAIKMYDDEIGQLSDTMNFMAEEILKADKLKIDFISSISHELRTPLTSIKGWSETLLAGDIEKNSELDIGLNIISGETDRLKDIVEELLDFSRLESTTMRVNMKPMSPKKVLEEVYKQFIPRAESINLTCNSEGEETLVMGDVNRIRQVFINLLANALKFTPPGGNIHLEAIGHKDKIEIKVSDTGIGISKDNIEKIREKFYKVSHNSPGNGLGLSIVDEILKIHSSTMDIESELGKGTVIKITMPSITSKETI